MEPAPEPPTAQNATEQASSAVVLAGGSSVTALCTQRPRSQKPTLPEVLAFARYLGIDPDTDNDLLWIAEEALEAPLPMDWTEHRDSNRVFYYNAVKSVSSWTHPHEPKHRDTYKQVIDFRSSSMSRRDQEEKLQELEAEVQQMERDVPEEIAKWTEHTDKRGNRFYFNREKRQSTWTDPRPAMRHTLHIRMKMLPLLRSSIGCAGSLEDEQRIGTWLVSVCGVPREDAERYRKTLKGFGADMLSDLSLILPDEWPSLVDKPLHLRKIRAQLRAGAEPEVEPLEMLTMGAEPAADLAMDAIYKL